ncbi:uncharacterized protein LOC124131880 isoform X1 [Haliotis rufescens]|uniref:uncharacterized protein LOC124131880 isoform X1 n=1 Tax=Haliotis rufescens TaxID=6454 RepID=UPI001EAFDB06|nr:uncharacterized protein LOC124131880 isoform X1 [Haliotis rufescens]
MGSSQMIAVKRKPNWSSDQTLLLVILVDEWKAIIKGKFGPGVTSRMKKEAWVEVAANINAAFPNVIRSTEDCEKRWYNIQSKSRQEIPAFKRQLSGTGGGPGPSKLSAVSEAVYDMLGHTNVSISGIEGSFDSTLFQVMDMSNSCQEAAILGLESEVCGALPHGVQAQPQATCTSASAVPCSRKEDLDDKQLLRKKTLLEIDVLQLQKEMLTLKLEMMRKNQFYN